jgi:hypothetical protein
MEALETLKDDIRAGRIGPERLVEICAALQRQLTATQQLLETAQQRIVELEKQTGPATTAKVPEPFSLRAEEQRQEQRGVKKRKKQRSGRRGRRRGQDKIAQAERTEAVFPEGVPPEQCRLSHTRPVWRLENGRAVRVAYQVYCGPRKQYGRIPGVLGRSEFGLEIVTAIAHLVYVVGLSFDKVCLVLHFFQGLRLRKSQTDALLNQLARHWQQEFETLCTLLAHSVVVHADETRWSLNSVWAFLSEKARVLLFGVPKDGATLQEILDPATFAGIVISDDAAVYANFGTSQKCWAHLLRKAIRLTLQDPEQAAYRRLTDGLLAIYRAACRVQRDGRLGDGGRQRKVAALEDQILDLCFGSWQLPACDGLANDYRLLVNEVMRIALDRELFTFVTRPAVCQPNGTVRPVAGTNNESERTLRGAAQARAAGRTNKTLAGARRQTIVASVLESLRLYLKTFTLPSVVAEVQRWEASGRSCFTRLLRKLHLSLPESSVLDRVLPVSTG